MGLRSWDRIRRESSARHGIGGTSEDRHHRSRYAPMTGLELLTVLHEQEPELPVILLTSHGHLDMHVDATQQGAYAYLRKPVDVATLKTVLASALASPAESEQDPLEVMTMRKHVVRLVT